MKEQLKKYWFILLVFVLLMSSLGYFVYSENKDKIKGLSENGQDIVLTIGDKKLTADELYNKMNNDTTYGLVYNQIVTNILDNKIPVTSDMKKTAESSVKNLINNYKQQYGDKYESYLNQALASANINGVDQIDEYFIQQDQMSKFLTEYYKKNIDKYYDKFVAASNPRLISHILVKMNDANNPSADEKAKMAKIDEELKTKEFGAVAKEYSDDTASAVEKGSIGLVDKNSQLVPEFLAQSLILKTGEVSQWVKTQYGYHLIKCDASDKETLIKNQAFMDALIRSDNKEVIKIVLAAGKELGLTFPDEQFKKNFYKFMEVDE
ncbi:MAG: peptidylprolyl isomerase [Erysipelotrichaceae bacterium]